MRTPAPVPHAPALPRILRHTVLAATPSGLLLVYLCLTWSQPNRPEMIAVPTVLLVGSLSVRAAAARIARGPFAEAVSPVLAFTHVVAFTLLTWLDGGIASPLGVMPFVALTLVAVVASWQRFVGYAVLTITAYNTVAVLGGPAPAGQAVTYTLGCTAVAVLCAVHAQALRSLRSRLSDVASLDPLTGCLNRGAFDARLEEEIRRATRTGGSVVLVLFDLDGFKDVNDTHGHAAGDALLRWTARTLADGVRGHDVVGRLGGDEFAVLLTGATLEPTAATAERLRQLLEPRSPSSVGAARFPQQAADGEVLRRLADTRLYEDKVRRGRPARTAVPDAHWQVAPVSPLHVAATERRRRSIEQTSLLTVGSFAIGVVYALAFAGDEVRGELLVLSLLGVVVGLAHGASARRLVRTGASAPATIAFTALQLANATTITVVDGGIASPTSLGLLSTMPLVALSVPRRVAVPVVAAMSAAYLAVAVQVGAPSPWFVVGHLGAFLGLSVACASHGRVAARQRRLLTLLSRSDSLTGCLNRRGFEERFSAGLSRAERDGDELSLLLLDLDDFKLVNDTRGHAAGDDLLRWVAQELNAAVRAGDSVGRLGGDEFAVLLPGCAAAKAEQLAARLRALLAPRTHVSLGTATLGVHGDDLESLYLTADRALYAQKSRPRPGDRRDEVGRPR